MPIQFRFPSIKTHTPIKIEPEKIPSKLTLDKLPFGGMSNVRNEEYTIPASKKYIIKKLSAETPETPEIYNPPSPEVSIDIFSEKASEIIKEWQNKIHPYIDKYQEIVKKYGEGEDEMWEHGDPKTTVLGNYAQTLFAKVMTRKIKKILEKINKHYVDVLVELAAKILPSHEKNITGIINYMLGGLGYNDDGSLNYSYDKKYIIEIIELALDNPIYNQ